MRCTLRRPATLPCACSLAHSLQPPFLLKSRVPHQSPAPDLDIEVVAQHLLSSCRATLFLFLPCIHQRLSASSNRSKASIVVVESPSPSTSPIFAHSGKEREPVQLLLLPRRRKLEINPFFLGTSLSLFSPTTT